MIRHISIRNFAIIDHTEIDFQDGLNIITGETGAGKSIVAGAISLALGGRADSTLVRSGQDKAVIQMVADDADGQEYLLSREISASGRNICRIDDSIVTLGQLSSLSKRLADIHGQYDHQSLLDPSSHIQLLDRYHSDVTEPAREAVRLLYQKFVEADHALKQLLAAIAEGSRQRDFMAFELQELEAANLSAGEDEALAREVQILQNSEAIYADLAGSYDLLSGGDYTVLSGLKQALDSLSDAGRFSSDLSALADRLSSLYYELEDVSDEVRRSRDRMVFSLEELDGKLSRLDLLSRLTAKHGKTIPELIDYRQELAERLADLEDSSGRKAELETELKKCRIALQGACNKLSDARKESARALTEEISRELAQLNFADSQFSVDFRRAPEFSAEGTDIVEFMISTNRGEDLKPLSKIASGGEMSRIMLAFKKIIGDYDEIPAMIFDEIDAGISGIAATVVGRKMREISGSHQIICITHLPQIAAFGDAHFRIEKSSDESRTYTRVTALSEDGRIDEIARLLGGETVTDITRRSARELVAASTGKSSRKT